MRVHLREPDKSAGQPGEEKLGQYQARADHAAESVLEGRRARRLPEGVLEVRVGAAAQRRHRRLAGLVDHRPPLDRFRTRGLERSAERLELFAQAARSDGAGRVAVA